MMGSIVLPSYRVSSRICLHLTNMDSLGKWFFFSDSPGENYQMDLVGLGCLTFLLEARTP